MKDQASREPCGPDADNNWRHPRWLPGVPQFVFRHACQAHDLMYGVGGTPADRLRADQTFRLCMLEAVASHRWYKRLWLHPAAWLYYRLVRWQGDRFFRYTTTVTLGGGTMLSPESVRKLIDKISNDAGR